MTDFPSYPASAVDALINGAYYSFPVGEAENGWNAALDHIEDGLSQLTDLAQGSGDCGAWQPIETRLEIDRQPGRQFILLEGSREHSGISWLRQHAGEAWIRQPGQPDEMLQYRKSDILRLCADGDMDPWSAKVTHWMPGKYPDFPSSAPSTKRWITCPECNGDCVVQPHGEGCAKCDGVGRLAIPSPHGDSQ